MCLSLPRWPAGGAGPFAVTLDVYRAANRGDADNYAKGVKDAMTKAGVWDDDRHVTSLTVRMFLDRERPRVDVEVLSLSPSSPAKAGRKSRHGRNDSAAASGDTATRAPQASGE